MTEYVLEILDGAQKGTVHVLEAARTTLGRKASNSLVVKDEKCSGEHAEIVREGDSFVLRDLGSTNGTQLDGRKVEEVALSPFDVFQIGRVQVVFRDKTQEMGSDDIHVATLDQGALERRGGRKKTPVGAILVGLLLLGGGGAWAWLEYGGGKGAGGGGGGGGARGKVAEPLVVRGDLLQKGIGNFEDDAAGWIGSELESAGFGLSTSSRDAHSGSAAFEAAHRVDEDDGTEYRLALAQTVESVPVTAESTLRLRGFLSTEGAARAALRLRFESSVDGGVMVSGSEPAAYDGYGEVELRVAVPRGVDRAHVQVLALLPEAEDRVLVDDVSLVVDREAKLAPTLFSTANGRVLTGIGSALRVVTGEQIVLDGLRPLPGDDPLLRELDRLGVLAPSDTGVELSVSAIGEEDAPGAGFAVEVSKAGAGIVLDFPESSGGTVVAKAGEESPFTRLDADFAATPLTALLLGAGETRCALEFAAATPVTGRRGNGSYEIVLGRDVAAFDLRVRFEKEVVAARALSRKAQQAQRNGEVSVALDAARELAETVPHDDRLVRDAQAVRVALLGELGKSVAELQREGANARYFNARSGFIRVATGIEALVARFGEQHIPQIEELRTLREQMNQGLTALNTAAGQDHRRRLDVFAEALDEAGSGLAGVVRDYVKRHYAATTEEGR